MSVLETLSIISIVRTSFVCKEKEFKLIPKNLNGGENTIYTKLIN